MPFTPIIPPTTSATSSIEDQLRQCCERTARGGPSRELIRPGHLGNILIRSGIQSVLADAQAGRFDLVLSEALDRISRDQDVAGVFRRLSFAGVTIVTLSEGQKMAAVEGQHGIARVEGSACVATI
ncbi:recombinase family protein [Mesorhizobium sp. M0909]|uniref:recombinase family protein n=1 Tax=Mesorhizobium sp. M0909 TaxID=2957024 RepID=UPI00333DF9C2